MDLEIALAVVTDARAHGPRVGLKPPTVVAVNVVVEPAGLSARVG